MGVALTVLCLYTKFNGALKRREKKNNHNANSELKLALAVCTTHRVPK